MYHLLLITKQTVEKSSSKMAQCHQVMFKGKLEHEREMNVIVLILIYVFCQHDKQNSFGCGQVKHG